MLIYISKKGAGLLTLYLYITYITLYNQISVEYMLISLFLRSLSSKFT